jgi:hypothetical protein
MFHGKALELILCQIEQKPQNKPDEGRETGGLNGEAGQSQGWSWLKNGLTGFDRV